MTEDTSDAALLTVLKYSDNCTYADKCLFSRIKLLWLVASSFSVFLVFLCWSWCILNMLAASHGTEDLIVTDFMTDFLGFITHLTFDSSSSLSLLVQSTNENTL